MRFDVLTIFPEFFVSPLREGIISRAMAAGQIRVNIHNIRDCATDRHQMTDDRPFGGGEGMVMKAEPLAASLIACREDLAREGQRSRVVLFSPRGQMFTQRKAEELVAECRGLILVCGRYEGVDERFRKRYVDEELSIGDYVLSGGELAALVVIDALGRLLPGVLGCESSASNDSFSCGLLKHNQYTRPRVFEDMEVPEVLLSGDHAAIAEHRFLESVRLTLTRRPEMLRQARFSDLQRQWLRKNGLLDQAEALMNRQET